MQSRDDWLKLFVISRSFPKASPQKCGVSESLASVLRSKELKRDADEIGGRKLLAPHTKLLTVWGVFLCIQINMRYDFDPQIAKDYGVEEAIMYSNIVWWCHKNATERSEAHFFEGKYWTWNTEAAWAELFGFWNKEQIGRILDNLSKGVSKRKKAKKGETSISEKLSALIETRYVGFKKVRYFCPIAPGYNQPECVRGNANIREGKCHNAKTANAEILYKEQIVNSTDKPQGATRRSRPLKKSETYETQEEIPGIQEASENQRSLIRTLYSLGWRWPKSKTEEEFGKSVKSALLVAGIAYHTTQGTMGLNQNLFDSELGNFQAYYEAKPTANPLSAFLGWMNRRAKK